MEIGHVSQNKYSKLLLITPSPSYSPYTCKQQHHPIISPPTPLGVCCFRKQLLFFLDSPRIPVVWLLISLSQILLKVVVLIYKGKENKKRKNKLYLQCLQEWHVSLKGIEKLFVLFFFIAHFHFTRTFLFYYQEIRKCYNF